MKETLDWRRGEVLFLKREKKRVDSLLRLCGKVKHLVQGTAPAVALDALRAVGGRKWTTESGLSFWGQKLVKYIFLRNAF